MFLIFLSFVVFSIRWASTPGAGLLRKRFNLHNFTSPWNRSLATGQIGFPPCSPLLCRCYRLRLHLYYHHSCQLPIALLTHSHNTHNAEQNLLHLQSTHLSPSLHKMSGLLNNASWQLPCMVGVGSSLPAVLRQCLDGKKKRSNEKKLSVS